METTRKKTAPAFLEMKSEDIEPLHAYTATPSHIFTVLGARRHPAINSPVGNAKDSISIFTSTGFQKLTNEAYRQSVDAVRPDVVIPLADMTYAQSPTSANNSKRHTNSNSSKRQLRMVERTEEWLAQFFELEESSQKDSKSPCVFAPLLPVSYPTQWEYFNQLEQDFAVKLSGLAVYDVNILPDLSNHEPLISLPRLSLDLTATPQEVLRQIQLGVDVFTVPFLNTISDAGIALSFTFPPPSPALDDEGIRPLGINMWSPEHEVLVKPLVEGCKCYACTKHHRAFLHHLLNAKEMLGWTLLQIHNYEVMSAFFAGVRASIEKATFEKDCDAFTRVYDPELPAGTGTRPRARGYHFKSRGGDDKINTPVWEKYGAEGDSDPALAGEMAGLAVTGAAAEGNETPLVPDDDAAELDRKGFAEISK
jgi:queuine tRNA-ribosyltransferase